LLRGVQQRQLSAGIHLLQQKGWDLISIKNSFKITIEENYNNGELNGVCKEWFENGQLNYEQNYSNGKKIGVCKIYKSNGTIDRIETWEDGRLIKCEGDCNLED
jgi:hypothetical protein